MSTIGIKTPLTVAIAVAATAAIATCSKTKQAAGKAMGNRDMQAEGDVQEAKGKGKVATGKVKDKLKGAVDRL